MLAPKLPIILRFVIPCKGRLQHLQTTLPALVAQAEQWPQCQIVVVDFDCPQRSGDWVQAWAASNPLLQVLRVAPAPEFHTSLARNLGARWEMTSVPAPDWLCFLDADASVKQGFLDQLRALLRPGHWIQCASSQIELAGFLVCQRCDFEAVQGYDEAIQGWGGEDSDLVRRLRRLGLAPSFVPESTLYSLVHPDVDRTRFHAIADRMLSLRINSLYARIKADLLAVLDWPELPREHRFGLYAQVRDSILANPDASVPIEITLPTSSDVATPPGWQLSRRWVYSAQSSTTS